MVKCSIDCWTTFEQFVNIDYITDSLVKHGFNKMVNKLEHFILW